MARVWIFIAIIGFVSCTAQGSADPAVPMAEKVIARMNEIMTGPELQGRMWFPLPRFNISFNNKDMSKWHFLDDAWSADGIKMKELPLLEFEDEVLHLLIPYEINNIVANFIFKCEDVFALPGYTYEISKTVTKIEGVITLKIVKPRERSCECVFDKYDLDSRLSEQFSEVTPNGQYTKQCIIRSYTDKKDYEKRIGSQFYINFNSSFENLIKSVTKSVDLCSQ